MFMQDFLQYQEFANVFDELCREDAKKRKNSPLKDDDDLSPQSKRILIKPEPVSLDESVYSPLLSRATESLRIKPDFALKANPVSVETSQPRNIMEPELSSASTSSSGSGGDLGGVNPYSDPRPRRYSSNMADCCTHRCRICSKSVTVTGMRNHSRTAHGVPIQAYNQRFGRYRDQMETVTWHKCGLCDKEILLDGDEIHKHTNQHRIMMAEYNAMFIVNNQSSGRRAAPALAPGRPNMLRPSPAGRRGAMANIIDFNSLNADVKPFNLNQLNFSRDVKPDLPSLPFAAKPLGFTKAPVPGPPLPRTKPVDVFGTIDQIESILGRMPDNV